MDDGVENTELGVSAKFGSGPMGDLGRNKSEVQEVTIWGLGVSPVAWARVVHRASGGRVVSTVPYLSIQVSLDFSRGRLGFLHSFSRDQETQYLILIAFP